MKPELKGDTRNKRRDGVRTLEDIRLRCFIDAETGCWLWRAAFSRSLNRKISPTTRVWLPEGLGDGKPTITTAGKAAWLLSGRRIPEGGVVWRHKCTQVDCINPAHGAAGTRPEMHKAVAASGRLKGLPHRMAANAINRAKMLTPVDVVRQGEALFEAGALQREVREQLHLASETARMIRMGTHPNSAGRQSVVRGASVFSLGAMA